MPGKDADRRPAAALSVSEKDIGGHVKIGTKETLITTVSVV